MNTSMPAENVAAAATAVPDVVAHFAQRVALRDVPPKPEPIRFDADSVRQRLQAALRRRIPRLTAPRREALAQLFYQFMTMPVVDSADNPRAERTRGRDWQQLVGLGLVERLHAGRQRRYRLTRAGEDWLLAVVQGTLPQ